MVESNTRILRDTELARRLAENSAGVEADDLHIVGLGIFGNLLQQESRRVLGEAVGWTLGPHGPPHVSRDGRDVDKEL
jgi:hypothetical protein